MWKGINKGWFLLLFPVGLSDILPGKQQNSIFLSLNFGVICTGSIIIIIIFVVREYITILWNPWKKEIEKAIGYLFFFFSPQSFSCLNFYSRWYLIPCTAVCRQLNQGGSIVKWMWYWMLGLMAFCWLNDIDYIANTNLLLGIKFNK